MNNYKITPTKERRDLLMEIKQIPEEYIPILLKIVRLLRQFRQTTLKTSINAWDDATNKINSIDKNPENMKKLFDSWSELDDENEQKEILKIIESIEGV